MRNLSLGILAITGLCFAIGIAQAAYVGLSASPTHPALAVHRLDRLPGKLRVDADGSGYYILRFKDAPLARYAGGIPGLQATDAHVRGLRYLDVRAPDSRAYAAYLDRRRGEILDSASRSLGRTLIPRFEYRYALNGVSVKLNPAEAKRIALLPDVTSVRPVRYFKPVAAIPIPAAATETNASRAWIDAPAVWQVPTTGNANEGEGIVVADLDTGINEANSSFAATGPLDGYVAQDPGGLRFGVCDPGDASQHSKRPSFFNCNDKLIGAYTYTQDPTDDPHSPEDSDGHGTHTASTAAGDFVSIPVNGVSTPLSGVAPHASLIAYDICDPTNLCGDDNSVAAVEQAIQDQTRIKAAWGAAYKGMVMNFSIGGTDDAYGDSVEQAFLSATEAGIYVSAAGGNGGPANAITNDPVNAPLYPVQHTGPWVATLAAATHDGTFTSNSLENFSGGDSTTMPTAAMAGDGATAGFGPGPLVYTGNGSFDADLAGCGNEPSGTACVSAGSAAADAAQCLFPFNPGTFIATEIVVCDRGTNPLVDKAYNVQQGGAAGMVIATTSSSSQDMVVEPYVIPATLLDLSDGNALRAWLSASLSAATQASADLSGASLTTDASQADEIAGFSSRGPTDTVYDDLIKPDVVAPGVSVLGAVSNPAYTASCSGTCSNQPETFDFLDGTSMATPHDTGAAALLMQVHHSWTVAEVKSALMLTAVTAANGSSPGLTDQCASLDSGLNCVAGKAVPSPQVRGAGRIDVDAAARSGIVLDETGADYEAADPDQGGDLTTLNLASLGNASCGGSCSWTRKLSSAFTATDVRYSVTPSGVSHGLSISVSPATFTLAHGATQTLTIKADTAGLAVGSWGFAQLDIAASGGAVGDGGAAIPPMHLTVAVKSSVPVAQMAVTPTELDFDNSGSQQISISNTGQKTLQWSLASTSALSSGNAEAHVPAPSSSLWDQPDANKGQGYQSSYYTQVKHGIYAADDFLLPAEAKISDVVAGGFAQDQTGLLPVTGEVDWYIYADAAGKPAGQPEDGKADYKWHYEASASAAGVSTLNGTISLDLAAAGQAPVKLPAGTYWLIVAPHFDSAGVSGNASWFWLEGKSANGVDSGSLIDPGQLLGGLRVWQALGVSFDFSLSGTLDCGNSMPGLSADPASGTVAAGQTSKISVTFNTKGLANGSPDGIICVDGNAPDNPQALVTVHATVSGNSAGGSGGGGGGLGLFGLASLLLALFRRKSF